MAEKQEREPAVPLNAVQKLGARANAGLHSRVGMVLLVSLAIVWLARAQLARVMPLSIVLLVHMILLVIYGSLVVPTALIIWAPAVRNYYWKKIYKKESLV
jgi:hypothetical protein